MEGRTYRYLTGNVLYPFGFGLTYSKVSLSDMAFADGVVSVKIANTGSAAQDIEITFKGVKTLGKGKVTTLHADRMDAVNTVKNKNVVTPKSADVAADGNVLKVTVPAKTFALYRF